MKRSKEFQKKLKKLEKEEKINFKEEWVPRGFRIHEQHTKQFITEMNSARPKTNKNIFNSIDDNLQWKIGKYKNIKLSDTPVSYIQWAHDNMKLSPDTKLMLKKYLNN